MLDTDEGLIVDPAPDSAAPESGAPITVTLTPCRCPKSPHPDGDVVILNPKLPLALGIAGAWVIEHTRNLASALGELAEVYLAHGIVGWSFVTVKGEPERITPESIARLLPYEDGGLEVAEAADALYQEPLMRPFRKRYPERFPPTPTAPSTSANPDSGSPLQPLSKPSSPNGTHGRRSAGRGR